MSARHANPQDKKTPRSSKVGPKPTVAGSSSPSHRVSPSKGTPHSKPGVSPNLTLMLFSTAILLATSFVFRDHLVTLATSAGFSAPGPANVVDTGYAKYRGNQTYPNMVAYLGIPYAEPPLGDLRFRAPRPLDTARVAHATKGQIVDASEYPNFCIQGTTGGGDAGGAGSEDCLKVNIYAPANAKRGSNLPVLVYIHGGGYIFGNPRNWPFDHWVKQSPNVVIVSVYYRLSSFGFLASPALKDGKLGDLNAGFLDQVEALKWVQGNIASFGGDPKKVTINGESAGGASVELHLVAKTSMPNPPFRGAIAQSVYRIPLPLPEQQQDVFDFYANRAGCGQGTVTEQMACLRKASVSALARAQDAAASSAFTASGYNVFHPVVDGKVIPDFPTRLITEGKFVKVPLVVGHTTNETLANGNSISAALKGYFPSMTDSGVETLIDAYPTTSFASDDLQVQTLTGDSSIRCATSIMGHAFSGAHLNTWTYRYNQRTPGAGAVYHAAENWMMFRGTATGFNGTTTFQPMDPTDIAFSQELIAYWLSFVRSGNPNTFKLARSPIWENYVAADKNRNVLQATPDGTTTGSGSHLEKETDVDTERCVIVAGLVGQQQA